MNRPLLVAALATVLLSLGALEAAAGPAVSTLTKTYNLQCSAGKTDGESLKANQTIVRNTSGKIVSKGTKITITLREKVTGDRFSSRTSIVTAYRDVGVNETIPMGESGRAFQCTATAQLPTLNAKVIAKRVGR